MHDFSWSQSEKRQSRVLFDRCVQSELAEIIAEFKRRAAAVQGPPEMWDLEDFLRESRTEFNRKYDYRYSQLIWVFGRLLREQRVTEQDLQFLSADKLEAIRRFLS